MKNMILLFILLSPNGNHAVAQDTSQFGFPPMADHYLNRMMMSALSSMGCRVSSHYGVQGDERHMNGRPRSCHNVARAIDIRSLSCANGKSNEQNLRTFASYFSMNPFILICYKDIGPWFASCLGEHESHLHFGGRQGLGCKNPFPY